MSKLTLCTLAWYLSLFPQAANPQQTSGVAESSSLRGEVRDESGRAIRGASVVLAGPDQKERAIVSDKQGKYAFGGLEPGVYSLRVSAANFAGYDQGSVLVTAGEDRVDNVILRISIRREEITVTALSGNPLVRGAEYAGTNIVLRGEALDALPDGPGGLEMLLRAMSLRTPGPFGPPILVNGFENNPIPAKDSIREIRINDNPFSAEYSQLGVGRVEILTKPGTDRFHGNLFTTLGDSTFNSRNPFSSNRPPFRSRLFGGDVSGPMINKRANFFVDFNREQDRSNAVINSTILDPGFNIVPFLQGIVTPNSSRSFGPRMDFQLNSRNTLTLRYSDVRTSIPISAIGGFSLPSRSQNATTAFQTAQFTESMVLSGSALMETKFQFARNRTWQSGNNSTPAINVFGSFIGGGADIGVNSNYENRAELHNATSWQAGRHILRVGIDGASLARTDASSRNFGGTYMFSGRLAPRLNPQNQIVNDNSDPVLVPISGIEQYRRTVLFRSLGMTPSEIRVLGGGASQFSSAAGLAETRLTEYQAATFVQDDWRLNPNFSLNLGLRWEYQNDISDTSDFAPRIGFALGLARDKKPAKTVLRGGTGIFYSRISDELILRARQLNGINQRQFFTQSPSILDLFPALPTPSQLTGFSVPQTIVQLAPALRAPYTLQSSLSIERDWGKGFSTAVSYNRLRSIHTLRSRNINAPLASGARPVTTSGDVFQYESSGVFKENQLQSNLIYRRGKSFALWATYSLSDAQTDSDGPDTFPANSYDLRTEYGKSSLDARHQIYFGGWISAKGLEFTPLLIWRTGLPYNITTGLDNNDDSLFTDRPAFANDLTRPSVIITRLGALDLSPTASQQIIPRNYGRGPDFFITNLRVGRRFKLSERLSLLVTVQSTNLFNRTNPGTPIGILSSPLFGASNSSAGDWGLGSNQAGNRRFELGVFFSY